MRILQHQPIRTPLAVTSPSQSPIRLHEHELLLFDPQGIAEKFEGSVADWVHRRKGRYGHASLYDVWVRTFKELVNSAVSPWFLDRVRDELGSILLVM